MYRIVIVALLIGSLTVVGEARAATPFVDVPTGHLFETEIDWMADEGITLGCNPPVNDRYCPDDVVTRGQMAAFLVRALGLTDDGGGDLFVDDDASVFAADIDRLGTAGITLGCNPPVNDRYCPDDVVTRGQMAAFLYRGLATTVADPVITTTTLPDTIVGAAYDTTLAATGGTTPHTWSLDSGSLPNGIALSAAGELSGNALYSGVYSFTVAVDDAAGGSDTANLAITVTDADLEITTTSLPVGVDGQPYSHQLEAIGGQPPYEWAVIGALTLPPNLVLDADGLISGTPIVGSGSGGIEFQVTDTDATEVSKVLTMTMTTAPVQIDTSVPLPDGTTGEEYEAELSLIGGVRPTTVTVVSGDLPPGVTMDTSGEFTGVPTVPGSFDFTVEAIDGAATSDTADITITVLPGPMTVTALVRASVQTDGTEGDVPAANPAMALRGRYVVFDTTAPLVTADTNGFSDIYRHDLQTGTTVLVSADLLGGSAGGASYAAVVSATGRYVAFESTASDLVAGDGNATSDVFVRDIQAESTVRVSVSSAGVEANGISNAASVSSDGELIAFFSYADNLVGGDANSTGDVFVHHLPSGVTRRVSVDSGGGEISTISTSPLISGDGSTAIFASLADNVVAADTNGRQDIFAVDLATMDVELVSADEAGNVGNDTSYSPSVSDDGDVVAFNSHATNLVADDINGQTDVFVHVRDRGEVLRASATATRQLTEQTRDPSLAGRGFFVAFTMYEDGFDLLDDNGHHDVYMYDILRGTLRRISVGPDGTQGDGDAGKPSVSGDGSRVAFESTAENLVSDDTNTEKDVFVVDMIVPPPS